MKEEQSTWDRSRKITSEILPNWSYCVAEQDFSIKFEAVQQSLEIEVLSIKDFKYYYGMFPIQSHSQKQPNSIPEKVVYAIRKEHQTIQFANGKITINYEQGSIFRKRYVFPTLTKLQLSGDIILELKKNEKLEVKLILANHKINELQGQKKIVFKELMRLQKRVNEEKRETELAQERYEQKKWLRNTLAECIDQSHKTLQKLATKIPKVNGEAIISLILLSFLVFLLKSQKVQ